MRLAELELAGFKSFPSKTRLEFNSGITSIVGPNGCGKSNLVDSIRWVLGEQSAKSLRGDRMESVIFSGSNKRNPGSLAEVSLTIDNNHNLLSNRAPTTRVTRRLYRNGESEYLLNGVPCLLRDFYELFADTGIGASAYVVMEQSMVESLISDKDESRREVFDEAAGITKYKLKRRLAARKLESTQADLLRLSDLVSEVSQQVSSLKRQMRKAEGYKNLKDQLKILELKVGRRELRAIQLQLGEIEGTLRNQKTDQAARDAAHSTGELELEQLKLELLEVERIKGILRRDLEEISAGVFKEQESIAVARQKTESHKDNFSRLEKELTLLAQQRKDLEKSISEKKEEAKVVLQRLEESRTEDAQLQSKAAALQKELDASTHRLEELNQAWSKKSLAVQQAHHKIQLLLQQIQELENQAREARSVWGDRRTAESELQDDLRQTDKQVADLQAEQERLLGQREELAAQVAEAEKRLAEIQQKVSQTQSQLASESSRGEVLKQVWSSYQGYQEGVRALLGQKEKFGLVDTVANLLETEETYLLAVEGVLGEKAGFLVALQWEKVLEAIESLKREDWGEAGFVLAGSGAKGSALGSVPKIPEGLIPLSTLVRTKAGVAGLQQILFNKIYLAQNRQIALESLPQLDSDMVLVTLEGEVFSAGLARGGKKKGPALLGRAEQIHQTEKNITRLQQESKQLRQQSESQSEELQSHKRELSRVYSEIEKGADSLGRKQIELAERKSLFRQTREILHNFEQESEKTKTALQELQKELSRLQAEKTEEEKQLVNLESDLSHHKLVVKEGEAKVRQASQELNRKMIDSITWQGEKERLENDSLRLVEAVSQTESSIQTRLDQKDQLLNQIQATDQAIQASSERLQKLLTDKETKGAAIQEQEEGHHLLLGEINQKENELKSTRRTQSEIQQEIHRSDLVKLELETQVRQLKEKIWEEYEVDLETVPDLEDQELQQVSQYQEQIGSLKSRLRNYGAVNLLALEEYQKEKERLDFLEKQRQDLVSAKETLESTIAKINDTARALFRETFQKVRANFQEVLASLFEGGEADLTLEEGIDPLEAKIEILAKPRGKKLVTLALLSGGEKALVAISLLFSLYLVKPSPFCILDEVDAPLDDPNIGRFIKLVRQFTGRTQFIIITHNKLTMEAADTLYGITMTEPGESRIVSVRLNKESLTS